MHTSTVYRQNKSQGLHGKHDGIELSLGISQVSFLRFYLMLVFSEVYLSSSVGLKKLTNCLLNSFLDSQRHREKQGVHPPRREVIQVTFRMHNTFRSRYLESTPRDARHQQDIVFVGQRANGGSKLNLHFPPASWVVGRPNKNQGPLFLRMEYCKTKKWSEGYGGPHGPKKQRYVRISSNFPAT